MKCSYCENELIDGHVYCLKCGRRNDKEINKEDVEAELINEKKKKTKKKIFLISSIVIILSICFVWLTYLSFSVKANNITSSYIEMDKEKIEQYLDKDNSIITSMAKKRINTEIQKISKDYMNQKKYDSNFYDKISSMLKFDEKYGIIDTEVIESLPTPEYAFAEITYNVKAESVIKYIDSLDRFNKKNEKIREDVLLIYNSYLNYADAEKEYNNKNYTKALETCNKIKVYEKDTDLKSKVNSMIKDINTKYSETIAQNLQNSYLDGQYEEVFELLESLKTTNETEYEKYYNEYVIKCDKKLEEFILNSQYEQAFELAKILYNQKNDSYAEKLVSCYEQYMNYLINSTKNEDSAKEITTEMLKNFADNEKVIKFNNYLNLPSWKKEYKKILENSLGTSMFALYSYEDGKTPFLLKMDNNNMTIYGMNGDSSTILDSLNQIIHCDNNEYVTTSSNVTSGYFEKTFYDTYHVYEVTNEGKIKEKYVLSSEYDYHYYAFTNQKYDEYYNYQKNGETISESEYNDSVQKFTNEINGFNAISNENIESFILNY